MQKVATGLFPLHVEQRDEGYYFWFPPSPNPWQGPFDSIEDLIAEAIAPMLLSHFAKALKDSPTPQ